MNLGQTEHQPNCDRFNTNLYLSVVQKRIRSWNIVRWFRSRFFSWQAMCLFQVSADPPPPPAASPGGSVTGVRVETVKAAMMPAARVAPGRVPADRSFGPARCWRQFRVDTPWFLLLRLLCWTVRETCCFAHPDQSPPAPSASCLELKLVENKNKHTLQDESCACLTWDHQDNDFCAVFVPQTLRWRQSPQIREYDISSMESGSVPLNIELVLFCLQCRASRSHSQTKTSQYCKQKKQTNYIF